VSEPAAARPAPQRGLTAFRYADFRNYFLARSLGRLSFEMQATAVGWQVYSLTGNPLDLGLLGLAQILPFMVLFPLAGLAADRFPRARVIASCLSVQILCAVALAVLTMTGQITFPLILIIVGLAGFLRAFQLPAEQSIIPLLTPAQGFSNAVAWTTSGNHISRLAGPGIGGLLIILGEHVVYASVAIIMTISVIFAVLIRANTQIVSRDPITFANVFAGLSFIWKRQLILGIISLDLFAVLLSSATALLPVFAKDILHVGPAGFGLLRAAVTVGSFTGSILFTQRPVHRHAGAIMFIATAVYGAATVLFALSSVYWLSFSALAVLGFADSASIFMRNIVISLVTPDQMRGRVNAVNSVFIGASNQLGEFQSGLMASFLGVVPAVVVGGIGTICVVGLFARIFPALRRLDSLDPDDLVRRYQ
jgi:MFS family permease